MRKQENKMFYMFNKGKEIIEHVRNLEDFFKDSYRTSRGKTTISEVKKNFTKWNKPQIGYCRRQMSGSEDTTVETIQDRTQRKMNKASVALINFKLSNTHVVGVPKGVRDRKKL